MHQAVAYGVRHDVFDDRVAVPGHRVASSAQPTVLRAQRERGIGPRSNRDGVVVVLLKAPPLGRTELRLPHALEFAGGCSTAGE